MLADDELDFDDDFGDLGELDTGGLTTEELEKELGLDLDIDLEPIPEESLNNKKDSKQEEKKAVSTSEENKKDENSKENIKQEKKETKTEGNNDTSTAKQDAPASPKKPETKQAQSPLKKQEGRPIPTTLDAQQNNNYNNNRRYNNNQMGYYPMQQHPMFYSQMQANFMAMNGMLSYQQQQAFTNRNRIYVNPNFKGGNAQVMAQRQSLDAQKSNQTEKSDEQKSQEELLNKQRQEAAETLRKKLAARKQAAGAKRKVDDDGPIESSKRPTTESIQTKSTPSNTGFSILGAAKARASLPVQNTQRVRSAVENNIKKLSSPSITSRLNRREEISPMARPVVGRSSVVVRPAQAPPTSPIPKVPIVTNGKSNVVTITNLKPDVTYSQIKKIVDDISNTNNISYTKEEGTATVTFATIELAVTFRRKYNRTQMGESHINIAFKK